MVKRIAIWSIAEDDNKEQNIIKLKEMFVALSEKIHGLISCEFGENFNYLSEYDVIFTAVLKNPSDLKQLERNPEYIKIKEFIKEIEVNNVIVDFEAEVLKETTVKTPTVPQVVVQQPAAQPVAQQVVVPPVNRAVVSSEPSTVPPSPTKGVIWKCPTCGTENLDIVGMCGCGQRKDDPIARKIEKPVVVKQPKIIEEVPVESAPTKTTLKDIIAEVKAEQEAKIDPEAEQRRKNQEALHNQSMSASWKCPDCGKIHPEFVGMCGCGKVKAEIPIEELEIIDNSKHIEEAVETQEVPKTTLKDIIAEVKAEQEHKVDPEAEERRKNQEALHNQSMSASWKCPDCGKIHPEFVGMCGCGKVKAEIPIEELEIIDNSKPIEETVEAQETPKTTLKDIIAEVKAEQEHKIDPEAEQRRKNQEALHNQSMSASWKCPDCGKIHPEFVGMCGCGKVKAEILIEELEIIDNSKPIEETVEAQETPKITLKDIIADVKAEQESKIDIEAQKRREAQVALHNKSMAESWTCVNCGRTNPEFVGMCACGQLKPQPEVEEKAEIPKAEPKAEEKAEIPKAEPKVEERVEIPKAEPKVEERVEIPKVKPKAEEKAEIPKVKPKAEEKAEIPKVEPKAEEKAEIPKAGPKVEERVEIPKVKPKAEEKAEIPKAEPKVEERVEIPKVKPKVEEKVEKPKVEQNVQKIKDTDDKFVTLKESSYEEVRPTTKKPIIENLFTVKKGKVENSNILPTEGTWKCPTCGKINIDIVGMCGCGQSKDDPVAKDFSEIKRKKEETQRIADEARKREEKSIPAPIPRSNSLKDIIADVKAEQESKIDIESKKKMEAQKALHSKSMSASWKCPDCGKVHPEFVGMCGCGKSKNDIPPDELIIIDNAAKLNESTEVVQPMPKQSLKEIIADVRAEQKVKDDTAIKKKLEAQRALHEKSMSFSWKCPDCGKIHPEFVGMCGCGKSKNDIPPDELIIVNNQEILRQSEVNVSKPSPQAPPRVAKTKKTGNIIAAEPMENSWICPTCGRENADVVGMCGCGQRKDDPEKHELKPVSTELAQSRRTEYENIETPTKQTLKEIIADVKSEIIEKSKVVVNTKLEEQLVLHEVAMANSWKCPDCGKVNCEFVGMCGCGKYKSDIDENELILVNQSHTRHCVEIVFDKQGTINPEDLVAKNSACEKCIKSHPEYSQLCGYVQLKKDYERHTAKNLGSYDEPEDKIIISELDPENAIRKKTQRKPSVTNIDETQVDRRKEIETGVSRSQTVAEKPVIEKPVIEKPVIEKPVIEKPVIEKPVIEKPVIEKPVIEKPVIEKPVIEKPVIEKPVIEKPVIEKPVIERPVAEKNVRQPDGRKVSETPIIKDKSVIKSSSTPEEKPLVDRPVIEMPVRQTGEIKPKVKERPIIKSQTSEEKQISEEAVVKPAESENVQRKTTVAAVARKKTSSTVEVSPVKTTKVAKTVTATTVDKKPRVITTTEQPKSTRTAPEKVTTKATRVVKTIETADDIATKTKRTINIAEPVQEKADIEDVNTETVVKPPRVAKPLKTGSTILSPEPVESVNPNTEPVKRLSQANKIETSQTNLIFTEPDKEEPVAKPTRSTKGLAGATKSSAASRGGTRGSKLPIRQALAENAENNKNYNSSDMIDIPVKPIVRKPKVQPESNTEVLDEIGGTEILGDLESNNNDDLDFSSTQWICENCKKMNPMFVRVCACGTPRES